MLAGLVQGADQVRAARQPAGLARAHQRGAQQPRRSRASTPPARCTGARLNPAKIVENRTTDSPDWFLDWAFEEVQRIAEGKGQYVLTARTTVDLTMQKAADEALDPALRKRRPQPASSTPAPSSSWKPTAPCAPSSAARLRRKPVQPRHARQAPARLVVQGLCLRHRARERLHADDRRARRARASCGTLEPAELRRQPRRRRAHAAVDGARQIAQHRRRRAVVRRRPREGHRDDPAPRHHGHPQDLLDGARRLRHHTARAHRRHRDLRQRRQARQALRHPRHLQLEGRSDLQPRARRARATADRQAAKSPSG